MDKDLETSLASLQNNFMVFFVCNNENLRLLFCVSLSFHFSRNSFSESIRILKHWDIKVWEH